jgi:hypothetical protein
MIGAPRAALCSEAFDHVSRGGTPCADRFDNRSSPLPDLLRGHPTHFNCETVSAMKLNLSCLSIYHRRITKMIEDPGLSTIARPWLHIGRFCTVAENSGI